jgi:hypothetical protein
MTTAKPISFMMNSGVKKKLTQAALIPSLLFGAALDHGDHQPHIDLVEIANNKRGRSTVTKNLSEIPNAITAFLGKNGGFIDKAGSVVLKKL